MSVWFFFSNSIYELSYPSPSWNPKHDFLTPFDYLILNGGWDIPNLKCGFVTRHVVNMALIRLDKNKTKIIMSNFHKLIYEIDGIFPQIPFFISLLIISKQMDIHCKRV